MGNKSKRRRGGGGNLIFQRELKVGLLERAFNCKSFGDELGGSDGVH
jgi:hypothetical protein